MKYYFKFVYPLLLSVFALSVNAQQETSDAPFELITDYDLLEEGDEIIIVGKTNDMAMGFENNATKTTIYGEDVIISDNEIENVDASKIRIITLEGEKDAWLLKTGNQYLAVGYDDSKNVKKDYVRVQDEPVKMKISSNSIGDAVIGRNVNKKFLYIGWQNRTFLASDAEKVQNSLINIYRRKTNVVTVDYDENDSDIKLKLSANLNIPQIKVNLKRSFVADGGWYSLCLPFDISHNVLKRLFGENVSVQEFASASGDSEVLMVNFTSTESGISAGKPYLIKPSQTVNNPVFKKVTITKDEPEVVEQAGYEFIGIFAPYVLPANDKTFRFLNGSTGTKLDYPSKTEKLKGTRAYFRFPKSSAQSAASAITDDATNIVYTIEDKSQSQIKIYRLDGVEVNHSNIRKGIYIIGGKKLYLK